VLRRLVPQWLADEAFQAIVLSYTAASIRHGGDGALYVRLRKPLR
jgi:DNA-nicking Smr family endonuclease